MPTISAKWARRSADPPGGPSPGGDPQSARRLGRPAATGGFTLLELMVVLLVAGILLTTVQLTVPARPDAVVEESAQRLAALTRIAQEEAIMRSQMLGIRFDEEEYRFLLLQGRQWSDLDDPLLQPREIDEALTLEFELQGPPHPEEGEEREKPPDRRKPPQVLIFPEGEMTPAEVTFRWKEDDSHWTTVYIRETGEVGVGREENGR